MSIFCLQTSRLQNMIQQILNQRCKLNMDKLGPFLQGVYFIGREQSLLLCFFAPITKPNQNQHSCQIIAKLMIIFNLLPYSTWISREDTFKSHMTLYPLYSQYKEYYFISPYYGPEQYRKDFIKKTALNSVGFIAIFVVFMSKT